MPKLSKAKEETPQKKTKGVDKDDSKNKKKVEIKKQVATKADKEGKKTKNASKEKSKKNNKYAGMDKGDRPNNETAYVDLELNVKPFRDWMKEHYELNNKKANIIGANSALAACTQVVCCNLLNGISDKAKKDKSGLVDITFDTLYNYVLTTPYLRETYGGVLGKYDSGMDYSKNLCVDKKKLSVYIEKFVFNKNSAIELNDSTSRLLNFLLVQTNVMLADTAFVCAELYGKSITSATVMAAAKVHLKGKLLADALMKLEDVVNRLRNKSQTKDDKSEDSSSEKKKTGKKGGKNSKEDENVEDDDDEDEEDNEDEEDDEDEENDDDEDEEDEEDEEDDDE